MKHKLLLILSLFSITILMTACSGQVADKLAAVEPTLSSDPCAAIDRKVMRLDRFTEVVKNTSAFHLEEKATALPVPGITVSNNRKQMLRDAEKKYAEYAAERQKQGCETPMSTYTAQMPDKKEVVNKPVLMSEPSADSDTKMMKTEEFTTRVNTASSLHVEEKAAVVPEATVRHKKESMLRDAVKKDTEDSSERQNNSVGIPMSVERDKTADNMEVTSKPAVSSDACASIVEELVKLDEFAIMVNNTSAFHLEEKAEAMPVPGITVSNNKKKMLRDVERKRVELSEEYEKEGCKTPEKK